MECSLTRGQVCHLQLLLDLATMVILGFESHVTRDHILLSQVWDFPFCHLLWLTGLGWRYLTPPPHGISLFRVRVTLRLVVYRLSGETRETHGQNFFTQMNTCGQRPYITSSLTWGWVCHLQLLLALASGFILGSESRGTYDHILLSQIQDFPFCHLLQLTGLRRRYSTLPPPIHDLSHPGTKATAKLVARCAEGLLHLGKGLPVLPALQSQCQCILTLNISITMSSYITLSRT
jgi:hypothetical protein